MSNRIKIKIVNPRPGGNKYTSLKQARKYLARGEAFVVDGGDLCILRDRKTIDKRLNEARLLAKYNQPLDEYTQGPFKEALACVNGCYNGVDRNGFVDYYRGISLT